MLLLFFALLTEAHAWHKGREEAEGVLAKIISGVETPTSITLNKKRQNFNKIPR